MDPDDPQSEERSFAGTFYESACNLRDIAGSPYASAVRYIYVDLFRHSPQGEGIMLVNSVRRAYHVFHEALDDASSKFVNLVDIDINDNQ